MSSTRADFALLLASPDPVEAELAKDLLSSEGIPSMLHGQDRDLAELGLAGHTSVARPDLLVPISALERAHEILSESWDRGALTDELALAYPVPEDERRPSRSRSIAWGLFVVLVVVVFILTYARYFRPRSLRPFVE
jgi:hypothetical protein